MARKKRAADDVWIELQRERAITLASLRSSTNALSGTGHASANRLCSMATPIKLGGTDDQPGITGLWLESYIK